MNAGFNEGKIPLQKPEGAFSFKVPVQGRADVESAQLGFFDRVRRALVDSQEPERDSCKRPRRGPLNPLSSGGEHGRFPGALYCG